MSKLDESREKARIQILSRLFSYPTISNKDWESDLMGNNPQVGDLVSLSACGPNKWYLSWVVDYREIHAGWPEYLLESIEDGALCWWSNVGYSIYSREKVAENPHWRWTDRQHQFNQRWLTHCKKAHDAYIVLPCTASFDERKVRLSLRIRFGFTKGFEHSASFEDFRKVTKAMMSEFYLAGVAKHREKQAA